MARPSRPKFVVFHEQIFDLKLSPNAKLILSNIANVTLNGGQYNFDNEFIQSFTKLSKRQVTQNISKLVTAGLIKSTLIYHEGTKQVHHRVLRLTSGGYELFNTTPTNFTSAGGTEENRRDNSKQVNSSDLLITNNKKNNIDSKNCVSDERAKTGSSYPATGFGIPVSPKTNGSARESDLTLFKDFWAAFGYSKNKAAAIKAWNKIDPKKYPEIILAVPAYVANTSKPGDGTDMTLRAYPASWLNGERWTDEVTLSQETIDEQWSKDMGMT